VFVFNKLKNGNYSDKKFASCHIIRKSNIDKVIFIVGMKQKIFNLIQSA
jgi:hypothetical protein